MIRLGVAIVVALMIGFVGGLAQYTLYYKNVDERLADFRPVATPVVSTERSIQPDVQPKSQLAPKVEVVGGTSHDFGTMQQGSSKSHAFTFRNIGKAPMKLEVAGSSCRCTIGKLADSVLEPGEETVVTLEWKATGVLDEFSQTATIATTDPEHRQVLLSVKGIVARTILIEPPAINLGEVSVSDGVARTAFVFGYGDVPLEIQNVKWSDDQSAEMVDIKITPMEIDKQRFAHHERANGAAQIDMVFKSGMPLGPINARMVLDTNIKNVSNVDLAVTGTVIGDIQILAGSSFEANRNILNIGTVERTKGSTSRLHLSAQGPHRDSLKLEVVEVVPKDSMLVTIGEPKQQLSRTLYPITCTVPENAPPAMFPGTSPSNFGKVVIKTSHPDIPELRVNLRIIVE